MLTLNLLPEENNTLNTMEKAKYIVTCTSTSGLMQAASIKQDHTHTHTTFYLVSDCLQ